MLITSHFLPYEAAWINDFSPLKIIQKSRQIGITYSDAYHTVILVSEPAAALDVFISSRDESQARFYLEDCKFWAGFLNLAATDLGEILLDPHHNATAHVLEFANGRRIYSLSSCPNALAGKRGHVKLDEFALHPDQRLLYQVAKPVTTWGGSLSIISTHRGLDTVFNRIIRDILEHGNTMGWSLHSVPLQAAVDQGLVEKINAKTGRNETRPAFLHRLRAECIDEQQWLQEYCCQPADSSAVFISFALLNASEDPSVRLWNFHQLLEALSLNPSSAFYLGLDVARKHDLCVFDLGERIGDVLWDRMRLELSNSSFAEIKFELYRLLRLPQVKRCCIDATGLGMQLAEEARCDFGWKAEPITFTPATKEQLAFNLRRSFEDRKVRLVIDDALRSDLRAVTRELTPSGNFRFSGETRDSHCDRFWAKALRQHAARDADAVWAMVA